MAGPNLIDISRDSQSDILDMYKNWVPVPEICLKFNIRAKDVHWLADKYKVRREIRELKCKECGKNFKTDKGFQIYCSNECRKSVGRKRNRKVKAIQYYVYFKEIIFHANIVVKL